jgi:hypothetical protein
MKIAGIKLSGTSIALLVIQLAAIYLFQRWTCPHVWTRTVAYDPELLMRGRYLGVQLIVDGCQSTLPSAKQAAFPRNIDGTTRPNGYSIRAPEAVQFSAQLKVEGNKLLAIRIQDEDQRAGGQMVAAWPGQSCEEMRLVQPVDFYIAEHAASPLPVKAGQELWIEVTIPPKGPPRPTQVAMKQDGVWKPLAFQ